MKKQKHRPSLARKVLASICSLAIASALVPAFAFQALAEEPGTEGNAILTVNTLDETTNIETQVASYTADELAALADGKTYNYLTGAKNATVYETSELVSADALLGGIEQWGPGAKLRFETLNKAGTATEEYTKAYPTYEEVTADQYYFPNYSYESVDSATNVKSGEDKSVEGKTAVKAGLALALDSAILATGGQKASEALNNVDVDKSTPRWMMGSTEDEYKANGPLGGKLTPGGVVAITIVYASPRFDINVYDETTETTTNAKSYTVADLADMADGNTYNYLTGAKNGTVYETSELVTADKLFAGIEQWGPGAKLRFETLNKAGTATEEYTKAYPTYEEVAAERYFFPNYSYESVDADNNKTGEDKSAEGKVAVPAGLALSLDSALISKGGQKASEALNNVDADKSTPRWMMGSAEDDYAANGPLGGKLTPSGVVSITIVYASPQKDQTITGAKASYSKTFGDSPFSLGAKASTKLSYKSSNAKVASVDASGKVTVKGAGSATITVSAAATKEFKAASKAVKVSVAKASQKVSAKNVSKTYKGKKEVKSEKLKKAQTIKLKASAKTKVTFKKTGKAGGSKIKVSKSGKVTVKKGLKAGTYKVKVKATAAAGANYKSASKTITVKVVVKKK